MVVSKGKTRERVRRHTSLILLIDEEMEFDNDEMSPENLLEDNKIIVQPKKKKQKELTKE